jgi:cell division septum initiation protein DivIVA
MSDKNICKFCNKQFSSKGNTKKHESICKKNPSVLPNKKKYQTPDYEKLVNIIEEQKKEIEEQKKEIESLKNRLDKRFTKNTHNISNNKTQNFTIINTGQSLKDIISSLEPLKFEEMKEYFENDLSEKYIDKGIEGLAQFICDVPCKDKFVTTDFGRQTILFKISEDKAISDPKATMLLNNTIKQNADTIIEKAEDRYKYYTSQIQEAREEDIEPDLSDVEKKNHTRKLKTIVQNVKDNISIEFPEATKVIVLKGMSNESVKKAIK